MRSAFIGALICIGMLFGQAAAAEPWTFGEGVFEVEGLPGFRHVSGVSPAVYHGPAGEAALISVHLVNSILQRDEAEGKIEVLEEIAKATFMKGEVRYGDGIGEISVQRLAGGGRNLAWVIDTSRKMGTEYLVMLSAISSNADVATITIEGRGSPSEALARFRPMLNTVRWRHAR
jgi:hypothetical protein